MPSRPPSIRSCGCLLRPGEDCDHSRKAKAEADKRRPTARQRGYDTAWDKARDGFLAKHPRCERCSAKSEVVHHKTPHRGDKTLFWQRSNWSAVCRRCHDGFFQSQEKRNV